MEEKGLSDSEKKYVSKVKDLASSDAIDRILSSPSAAEPKIFYRDSSGEKSINSRQTLVQQAVVDYNNNNYAVCVIENISPAHIGALGSGLSLEPYFFANHATHVDKERFWEQFTGWSWDSESGIEVAASLASAHIDGMFEYNGLEHGDFQLTSSPNIFRRDVFKRNPYPVQSSTRISYCRANPYLCKSKAHIRRAELTRDSDLFLVDAPLAIENRPKPKESRSRTTCRFRYSQSRGGLPLPQLFSQQSYSLFESFRSLFQHTWHIAFMFNGIPGVLPAHALLYMFSSSIWETNLRFLDSDIKRISFRDLRDPKDSTNDDLHDRREDLEDLKALISETVTWVPPTLPRYYEKLSERRVDGAYSTFGSPIENLRRVRQDADRLQSFLNDTFQLLMSSIAVRDSRSSMEQARRSAWLTQLASLYLPLSVLTGIFGMNLKEINGSSVPFWWSIVVLGILALCTVLTYFGLRGFGSWKEKRDTRKKIHENA
ncbi:MAG: hypothetical protein Q9160_005317 [Pyrenula sp. 1 TL-2023]